MSRFFLSLFLVDSVCFRDGVELFEFKFLVSVLLFVFAGVVHMTFTNALGVSHRNELYEFVL